METEKIVNLLNSSENEYSKFTTKKFYLIDSEANKYSKNEPIMFLTRSIESSLCDFSDAYVLVTGDIAVTGANDNTKVAFKNCAPFRKCRTNK